MEKEIKTITSIRSQIFSNKERIKQLVEKLEILKELAGDNQ
jgi:hypothetical protein